MNLTQKGWSYRKGFDDENKGLGLSAGEFYEPLFTHTG
jgi:hypothetical protein